MKVVHLSRWDRNDSASRSARAIDRQLREEMGVDSRIGMEASSRRLSESGGPSGRISPRIDLASCPLAETGEAETYRNAQSFCFDFGANSSSSSAFELGYPGFSASDLLAHPEVLAADLIHLHQVAGFVSPASIGALLAAGKPVIWSLPDHWPFTGGCFHSNLCADFQKGCADCPQLARDDFSLPAVLLADKQSWFSSGNLTLVVPGADQAERVAGSLVFRNARVEALAIPPGADCWLAGRESGRGEAEAEELRIVFAFETPSPMTASQLSELLGYAQTYGAFRGLVRRGKVKLAVSGLSHLPGTDLPIEFLPAPGAAGSAQPIGGFDLLVFPAIQENRPALLFEALGKGLPVLAEPQAGLAQWLVERENGWISKRPGVKALAESLAYLAANPGIVRQMARHCQPLRVDAFAQAVQRLLGIYERALQSQPRPSACLPPPPVLDKCRSIERAIATRHVRDFLGSDLLGQFQQAQRAGKSMEALLVETQQSLAAIERRQKEAQEAAGNDALKSLAQAQKALGQLRNKLKLRLRRIRATESSRAKLPERPGPPGGEGSPGRQSRGQSGGQETSARKLPVEAQSVAQGTGTEPVGRVSWLARVAARALTPSGQKPSFKIHLGKPRPVRPEVFPRLKIADDGLPRIALVTPSFMQGEFLEKTLRSVLDQHYPNLVYAVQDGGSSDRSLEVIQRYADRLTLWASEPDSGQTRAILSGFEKISGKIMGWLNSDDLLMPGALRFIGDYFASHPEVDAIYGNRVLIDEHDLEFARWILPPHNPQLARLIDPVPQETFFWRSSFWEKVGGLDPEFRFAMDWDFILRLQNAGANIVHVPYFLGCFRVHSLQKTSAQMECLGAEEMAVVRWREHGRFFEHGDLVSAQEWLDTHGAIRAGLMRFGIRLP